MTHTSISSYRVLRSKYNHQDFPSPLTRRVVLPVLCLFCSAIFATIAVDAQQDYKYANRYSGKATDTSKKRHSWEAAMSTKGYELGFVTPDQNGGVWLSGNALLVRGLLVNDGSRQTKTVTIQGLRTAADPQFITPAIGWFTDHQNLYHSVDGGGSWSRIDSLPSNSGIHTFYFSDVSTGWAGGWRGEIYRTTDGGHTWKLQNSGLDCQIQQLFFYDKLHGWATAFATSSDPNQTASMLRTKDGGETWEVLWKVSADSPQSVRRIVFANVKEGWGIDGWQNNIVHTADGGLTWTVQRRRDENGWNSVFFMNNQEGWASGQDGIIHTTDGGQTWEVQLKAGSPLSGYLDQITFVDQKRGWVVSREGALKTTDGGESWKPISRDWKSMVPTSDVAKESASRSEQTGKIPSNVPAVRPTTNLSSASAVGFNLSYLAPDKDGGVWITGDALMIRGLMVSDRAGQVAAMTIPTVGDVSQPQFLTRDIGWMLDVHALCRTLDGGRSWQKVPLPHDLNVWGFHFSDVRNGWAVGKEGVLYRTTDAGQSWTRKDTGLDYDFKEVFFTDPAHGWLVGSKPSGNLRWKWVVMRTEDGGGSWEVLSNEDSTSTSSVSSLQFVDPKLGWALNGQGNIVSTTDGGKAWTEQWTNERQSWNSLFFLNDREGWAAGNYGILHTGDGGQSWEWQLTTDGLANNSVHQVAFIDADRGWAVGGDRVLRTIDGGKTWQTIGDDWKRSLPSAEALLKEHSAGPRRKQH